MDILDLHGVEVEHMLGDQRGPLVKVRCLAAGAVLLGQLTPADARQIAAHLHEAAARAEYESDLFHTMKADGWTDEMAVTVLFMARRGEADRHTNQGGPDGDHT